MRTLFCRLDTGLPTRGCRRTKDLSTISGLPVDCAATIHKSWNEGHFRGLSKELQSTAPLRRSWLPSCLISRRAPSTSLIEDLKRTGLWEETLLIWGGEFGRTPTSEGIGKPGRDHNWLGFTMWLAGAGVKGGQAIGATDELGFEAVEDPYHVSDLHATVLHLMGLDHTKLTYFYHGLEERLTGQRGQVIEGALA